MPSTPDPRPQRQALAALAFVLGLAGALVFLPCAISIVLASWFALLTRPMMMKLASRIGGRTRSAAIITTGIMIAFLGPILLGLVPVVVSAVQLASEVGKSKEWQDAAQAVGDVDGVVLNINVGVGGITFTSSNKIEFVLTHSDDNSSYAAVAAADVVGATVATGGIVLSLVAAHAAASSLSICYVGAKKYLKLLADFSGTHTTGTPIAAQIIKSLPHQIPIA